MRKFKLTGKWLVVSSITLVVAIIAAGGYYAQHKLENDKSPDVVQAAQMKKVLVNKPAVIKQNTDTQPISDEEAIVYNTMHKMINTKIVAQDGKIWGEIPITTDKCNQLIKEVTNSGYPDKVTLLQFLTRWKEENFVNGVDEHNYLWEGLNGTIGKAKSLRF